VKLACEMCWMLQFVLHKIAKFAHFLVKSAQFCSVFGHIYSALRQTPKPCLNTTKSIMNAHLSRLLYSATIAVH